LTELRQRAGENTYAEILSEPQIWHECLRTLDATGELGRLLGLIPTDKERIFVGCGSSFYLALTAAATWSLLTRENARAVPASEVLLFPGLIPDGSSAILISRSGHTSEIIRAGDYFRRQSEMAPVAITCGRGSPIEEIAAQTIRLPQADEKSTVMTRSFTSMLLTLQMLAAERGGQSAFATGIRNLSSEMSPKIREIDKTARRIAESHSFEDYVFLGQGPFYGIAQEAMLKVTEMSCSYAQCFHTLEFRHGPKAIVSSKTLVTFFLSETGLDEEVSVLREIKDLSATTLVVTNEASTAVRESADYLIELSLRAPEAARAAAFVVPGQLLGLHIGIRKGFDPDHPRHLSRVVTLEGSKDGDSRRGAA